MSDFTDYLISRGLDTEKAIAAESDVLSLKGHLEENGKSLDDLTESDIREYLDSLIRRGENTMDRLINLARYFKFSDQHENYIFAVSTISGREVLDSISEKLVSEMGTDCRNRIFQGLDTPPLGSPPETYVRNTCSIVERLLNEGEDICHGILADNHHGIPRSSFDRYVALYRESESIDDFLRELHRMRVDELQEHLDRGSTWFEQEITPEVIEYVRSNQEILSAVRRGNYLYVTKIPYDPGRWLEEDDPVRKRYLACHCPLARESILMDDVNIPGDWCYCSGGFQKRMFDVLFNEFTEVELLESVLAGADRCRFRIRLP